MARTPANPAPTNRGAQGRPGLRALAETIDRLTAPLVGSQRLLAADLVLAWATLAGGPLAAASYPDRLVFPPKRRSDGTLHLRVASGAAALELQHESRRLIDRINAHLGYAAVARLKLVQAPLPPARPPTAAARGPIRPSPPSSSTAPEGSREDSRAGAIDALLTGVEDERLRDALVRLGRRVLAVASATDAPATSGEACRDDGAPV